MTGAFVLLLAVFVGWLLFGRGHRQHELPAQNRLGKCADCGFHFELSTMQRTRGVEGLRCPDCWGDLQAYIDSV